MQDIADLLPLLPPEAREASLNGPAHAPPPGVVPNFDHPQSGDSLVMGVITTGVVLATLLLMARIYSRVFCLRKVRIEDGLIVAGYGTLIAFAWCHYSVLNNPGVFVHQWDIRLRDLSQVLWIIYLGINFYVGTIVALKPAILLEWSHTFVPRNTRNTFWWACHMLLIVNVLFYGSVTIATNLSCQPHNKIWDKTVQGTCIDDAVLWTVVSSINLVSDVIILILPQRVIWKLKLSKTKKFGVSIIFAFGLLTCLAATLRIVTSIRYLNSTDRAYTISAVAMCCWAEMIFLFVVACVPSVPAVARSLGGSGVFTSLKLWTQHSYKKSQSSGTYYSEDALNQAHYDQVDGDSSQDKKDSFTPHPNGHSITASTITRTTHISTVSVENNPNTNKSGQQQNYPWETNNRFPV